MGHLSKMEKAALPFAMVLLKIAALAMVILAAKVIT